MPEVLFRGTFLILSRTEFIRGMMLMNNKLRMLFMFSLGLLLCFGLIALNISRYKYITSDSVIISLIQGLEAPTLTSVMIFFTELGSSKIIYLIGAFLLIFLFTVIKKRSQLILIPIVFIGARMLNQILKALFHRERPDLNRLIEIGGYSFPSGHAMNAMAFYGIVTFVVCRHISSRWGRALFILIGSLLILMIGISRVYLGVHYPSDVIAGYFASGFCLVIVIWIYYLFKEMRQSRNRVGNEKMLP